MDCSLPGSSVCGILQARILEWIVISFSRGSSRPRDRTCVSCTGRVVIYHWAMRVAHNIKNLRYTIIKMHSGLRLSIHWSFLQLFLHSGLVAKLLWPHGLQPARLLCSWDSPGKNTGVGCHFLLLRYSSFKTKQNKHVKLWNRQCHISTFEMLMTLKTHQDISILVILKNLFMFLTVVHAAIIGMLQTIYL